MARAHHEAPKAEKPKDVSHHFDLSDTNAEMKAAAPKKRARSAPPVPVEAYRPRKRAAKKAAAEAPAETATSPDVTEALEMVRATAEEGAWDAKIAEAKEKTDKETPVSDDDIESIEMEAEPASDEERKAMAEDAEWEDKISAAKK